MQVINEQIYRHGHGPIKQVLTCSAMAVTNESSLMIHPNTGPGLLKASPNLPFNDRYWWLNESDSSLTSHSRSKNKPISQAWTFPTSLSLPMNQASIQEYKSEWDQGYSIQFFLKIVFVNVILFEVCAKTKLSHLRDRQGHQVRMLLIGVSSQNSRSV